MGRKPGPKKIQFSVRLFPETFAGLEEAATLQGTDINTVLNAIILEGLPSYVARIRDQQQGILLLRNAPGDFAKFKQYPGLCEALLACRRTGGELRHVGDELTKALGVDIETRTKLTHLALQIYRAIRLQSQMLYVEADGAHAILNHDEYTNWHQARSRLQSEEAERLNEWRAIVTEGDQPPGSGDAPSPTT